MTDAEADILLELAKLLKKYGPGPFEALAQSISAPETSARLAWLLTKAAEVARSRPRMTGRPARSVRRASARSVGAALDAIKADEPDKYYVLSSLYEDLKSGRVLPTVRDIRSFLTDRGLGPISATARDRAITSVMRLLIPLPTEQLKKLSAGLPRHESRDRELEGWSRVILQNDPRR